MNPSADTTKDLEVIVAATDVSFEDIANDALNKLPYPILAGINGGLCGLIGVIGSYFGPQLIPSIIKEDKLEEPYTFDELALKSIVVASYAGMMTYHVNKLLEQPTNPWAYLPVVTNAAVLVPWKKVLNIPDKEEQLNQNLRA